VKRAREPAGDLERGVEPVGVGERVPVHADERVEIGTALVIGRDTVDVGTSHFACGRGAGEIPGVQLTHRCLFHGERRGRRQDRGHW
jgi:hypothetical protein